MAQFNGAEFAEAPDFGGAKFFNQIVFSEVKFPNGTVFQGKVPPSPATRKHAHQRQR